MTYVEYIMLKNVKDHQSLAIMTLMLISNSNMNIQKLINFVQPDIFMILFQINIDLHTLIERIL